MRVIGFDFTERLSAVHLFFFAVARSVLPLPENAVSTEVKQQLRVLFVEDDSSTREGYSAYLATCGFTVIPAATGAEALALANSWDPHVIVLDLGLPDIDGWEVARQLKAGERTVRIPIIALTGSHMAHERVSAMRAGCDRHLSKPCLPANLVAVIHTCVGDGQ